LSPQALVQDCFYAYFWLMRIFQNHVVAALVLAFLAFSFLSGCKKQGCTDPVSTNYDPEARIDDGSCSYPGPPTLALHVTHTVGNQPFSANTTFQDSSGRSFQLSTARFYVSGIALQNGLDSSLGNRYLHVVAGQNVNYNLGEIDPGSYTGLKFNVGVDSVTNHSDPLNFPEGHALSLTSPTNDHWTWNVGYVFLKIEGVADTSRAMTGNMNRFFVMHIATDPLFTVVQLSKNFDVTEGESIVLNLKVDWLKALSGYDFRRSTHTTDVFSIAQRAMNNFVSGIQIE
jgi:hypothetical protein